MALILAVVGSKDSGKTTTIEYLTKKLAKEGLKVGVVKHIHDPNFSIDTPRKDTFRFAQAGAKIVASATRGEIAVIKKINKASESFHLQKIFNFMGKEKLDVIFLEGFHSAIAQRNDIHKIITAKNQEGLENTLRETAPPILAATGLIACQMSKSQASNMPVIDVLTEGETLLKLVKNVLSMKSSHGNEQSEN